MKLNQLKSDESKVPVSDRDASLVERPVTEVHKDPPALILVRKLASGKQSAGHGSKLKRQKEEAIVALLTNRSIEEAARAARIGSATLVRWLKQDDFNTEYREARRAAFLQAIARLQQVASAAVSLLLKVIADPNAPAAIRVRAADSALKHARCGMEIEDILARMEAIERAINAPKSLTEVHKAPTALILVKKPAGGKESAGHGSKLKRQKEEAIVALLTHRSIEEAARAVRIGSATLVRWLKQKDFNTEFREARRAAFLQAIARLQQVASVAVSLLMKMIADPNAPAAVRVRAADSALKHARCGMEIEDIDARLRDLERAQSDKDNRDDLGPNSEPGARAEIRGQTSAEKMVVRLNEARERMNQEDELARQTAAAAAAMEKSEVTEP